MNMKGKSITAGEETAVGRKICAVDTPTNPIGVPEGQQAVTVSLGAQPAPDGGTAIPVPGKITADGTGGSPLPAQAPAPITVQAPVTAGAPADPATATPVQAVAAAPAPGSVEDIRAKAAAEFGRIEAVRAKAKDHPDIMAKAVAEGWTADKTELECLRASRPSFNTYIPSAPENGNDVIAAAVCQTCGLPDIEKHFREEHLEAAQKRYKGSIGLNQMMYAMAAANGYNGDPFFARSNSSLRKVIRAAFSTNAMESLISNIANKFLGQGFASVEETWKQIAAIRPDVQDFREYETYYSLDNMELEPLAQDGRLKHGTLGDEAYKNQLETFGRMIMITRKAFINDDIGILRSATNRVGAAAANSLNSVFWKVFLDNAAFFTAQRGNLTTGAGSALGEESLKAALTKIQTYTKKFDGAERAVGRPAKFLLTGLALQWVAREWLTSPSRVAGGTTPITTTNALYGAAIPLVSRYITSGTNWYLLVDPNEMPTIEVGFLRGMQMPTIEEVEADSDQLGFGMRVYWDFGVRKQIHEAGLKVTGAA